MDIPEFIHIIRFGPHPGEEMVLNSGFGFNFFRPESAPLTHSVAPGPDHIAATGFCLTMAEMPTPARSHATILSSIRALVQSNDHPIQFQSER